MFLFYKFYINKLENINSAVVNIQFDTALARLSFKSVEDENTAREMLIRYRESLAAVQAVEREAKIYSAIYLFFLIIGSTIIFIIIFHFISKPLNELNEATLKIESGDFSINLKEAGFKEIVALKRSFNSMSKELKNTQEKLLESEKEHIWKEFSRTLAHEKKNPLTPIQLTLQRHEEKFDENPKKFNEIFHDSVKIIDQEIQNLFTLASSFSNFAKNPNPEFSMFNPYETIKEIITPYQSKFAIKLSGLNDVMINFDKTHFYQIITNLLQNAIDASEESNEINISIADQDNKVIINIKDNGCGIDKTNIKRIFEPYFSEKKKGIGLGLALVKRLVEVNNSKILVHSRLNIGTEFEIIVEKS